MGAATLSQRCGGCGAVRSALVFVCAVVCVSGAAAAAAAAVDVNVATPESLSRACARKGRTALRKYLTNARLPDKSKMADRQISPLCRSHRKINARSAPWRHV